MSLVNAWPHILEPEIVMKKKTILISIHYNMLYERIITIFKIVFMNIFFINYGVTHSIVFKILIY